MKYIFYLLVASTFGSAMAQNRCNDPKTHEFDFWIGNWTVYKNGTDTIVGYNEIKAVAGGCSLLESYKSARGSYTGNSLNKYNFLTGKWEQFWVDSGGLTLFIQGNFGNEMLTMENEVKTSDGKTNRNKITWYKNSDGTVRQLWQQSTDNGQSWTVAFDGIYRKS